MHVRASWLGADQRGTPAGVCSIRYVLCSRRVRWRRSVLAGVDLEIGETAGGVEVAISFLNMKVLRQEGNSLSSLAEASVKYDNFVNGLDNRLRGES
jgi:hypothetical protein